jgi:hypothetical protein
VVEWRADPVIAVDAGGEEGDVEPQSSQQSAMLMRLGCYLGQATGLPTGEPAIRSALPTFAGRTVTPSGRGTTPT